MVLGVLNDKSVRMVSNNGVYYTVLGRYKFLGRNISTSLLKLLLGNLTTKTYINIYEGSYKGSKLDLLRGSRTKPTTVAITINDNGLVGISDSYDSDDFNVINWSTVGVVEVEGQMEWMHPSLNRDHMPNKNPNGREQDEEINLDFQAMERQLFRRSGRRQTKDKSAKDYFKEGATFKVLTWGSKRNRRGMVIEVTAVTGEQGFHMDAYFNGNKVGDDFIPFLQETSYKVTNEGVVHSFSETSGELLYSLEPLNTNN